MVDKNTQRYLINVLRKATLPWWIRGECLRRASKRFQNGFVKGGKNKGKQKWITRWKCSECGNYSRSVEVDHIEEVGGFHGDWTEFINRLFCHISNLQVLCVKCHAKKTSRFLRDKISNDRGIDIL